MQAIIFFLVSSVILFGIHFYAGKRLVANSSLSDKWKRIWWRVLMGSPLFLLISNILRFAFPVPVIGDLFGWIGYVLFGYMSVLLALLLLRDVVLGLNRLWRVGRSKLSPAAANNYDPQRREFLIRASSLGLVGLATAATGYGVYEARRKAILETVEVPIKNLPQALQGFTIAQFTDLHVGPTIKRHFVQSVVNQVNELNADMIVFTGDLVDGTVGSLRDDVAPLAELSAEHGVYFVTGNHEYYSGAEAWVEEVDRLGMQVLNNTHQLLRVNGKNILLAGITDYSGGNFIAAHKSDPAKALQNAAASDVRILLAHQPRSLFAAEDLGIDLMLSGHTHGGQYLPWNGLVVLNQPFVKGLHRHRDMQVYVSRGTGYWGPPLRTGVPSEVTLIKLFRA